MKKKQVVDYIENGNIVNSVNYPRLELGPKTGKRVVVLFEGDKIKEVSEVLNKANITKMASGLKGAFGALVAEVGSNVDVKALKAIKGVTRVMVI